MNPRVLSGAREKITAETAAEMITNSGDESTEPEDDDDFMYSDDEQKGSVKGKPHVKKRLVNGFKGQTSLLSRGKQMVNMVISSFKKNSTSSATSTATSRSSMAVLNGRGRDSRDDDEYDFKEQHTPPKKTYERIQRKNDGKIVIRAVNSSSTTPSSNKRPPPGLNQIHRKKRVFEEDAMDLKISRSNSDDAKRKRGNENEEKVDFAVLRELPEDIRREMAQHYGIDLAELERQPSEPSTPPPYSPIMDFGVEAQETYSAGNHDQDSTDETIEAVLKASKEEAEAAGKAVNPYENVDEIDPTFLCALPNNLRNEVLLQVQEAKEKRGIMIPQNLLDSPQPCSSRQFLERQRLRREAAEKAAAETMATATEAEGANEWNDSPPALVPVTEDLEKEIANSGFLDTPPPADPQVFTPTPPPSSSTGTGHSRLNSKSSSTRRRLDFGLDGNEVKFTSKQEYPRTKLLNYSAETVTSSKWKNALSSSDDEADEVNRWKDGGEAEEVDSADSRPALNNATEEEDVRNEIRKEIETIKNPVEGDVASIFEYFFQLVSRGWINESVALLRFLFEQVNLLEEDSPWRPLLVDLIHECEGHFQNHCESSLSPLKWKSQP